MRRRGLAHQERALTTMHAVDFQRQDTSRAFAINAGLDMVYICLGAALWAFGPNATVRGTGAGMVTQGGFLVAFDTVGATVAHP